MALANSVSSTMMKTFYKRPLPSICTSFSSELGKSLFKKALQTPYMNGYFNLANNFLTQSEPAFCGLSCLSMVLNSLEVDPQRKWKGGWRWYSEEMLDCCTPLERVLKQGITFEEFSCLAACNGLKVKKYPADKTQKKEFIEAIEESCSSEDKIVVVSFSRPALQQTGDGHFSPIGGYEPESKMALVLDVARYKYPSYWVHVDMLWESLHPIDKETGRSRGFFVLQKSSMPAVGLIRFSMDPDAWSKFMTKGLHHELEDVNIRSKNSLEEALPLVFSKFSDPIKFLEIRQEQSDEAESGFFEETHKLLHEASVHPLYSLVKNAIEKTEMKSYPAAQSLEVKMNCHLKRDMLNCIGTKDINIPAALATIFFLSIPREFFNVLGSNVQTEIDNYFKKDLQQDILKKEVERISHQMNTISEFDKNDSCKRCSNSCSGCSSTSSSCKN